MQPLTQDPFSPEERFENAVEVLKRLAAKDDSDPPFGQDGATGIRKKPIEPDPADIAQAAGQDGPESDLIDILNSFEFSLEEAEERERPEKTLSEKTCPDRPVIAGRKGEPRPALPRGSFIGKEKSSAGSERVPDRKDLPSLKIVVGMITLAQIAAAIVLAFALVSWLSVHPLDSFRGPQGKGLVEQPSLARSAMNDPSDSIATALRTSGFAAEPSAAIPASSPAPVDMADGKGGFAQPEADPPGATRLEGVESAVSTRPAHQPAGRETPFDNLSIGAEHPDALSAQASPSRSMAVAQPPAPEKAEPPGASAARAAAASLRDRAEAEVRKLSVRQDLRQALRSRAAREWQSKLAQDAVRDLSAPRSEPVSAALDSRELHVLQNAELLLRNSDINGARLVLEKAAADGSGRAVYLLAQTYDPGILQDRWSIRDGGGDPVKTQDPYLSLPAAGVQDGGTPPE